MSALPHIDAALVLSRDYGRLRAERGRLERARVPVDDARWAALAERVAASEARRAARAASVPPIAIPEDLPIAVEAERIVALIRRHQVLVVAGETGSGKTTQLPKLCLAAGRGAAGMIGCTQPRRIAARTVARRVAQELGTEVGKGVGFQVRFTEQVGEQALVKFMTDGILLAETQGDRWLGRYDTIILDEAHERSLNIDFLLGYLKRLCAERRDLKVIVTSATIDTERFARHFGGAPVVEVAGRTYPVEVRWRPEEGATDRGREAAPSSRPSPRGGEGEVRDRGDGGRDPLLAALDEITREAPLGDVLVFLPGEREIRDAHLMLERRRYRETEILPLYARLSARDQDRVFNPGPKRRVVLATNVAETSLTVPRIRYVVDPGIARVNRYSHRHKVQRLHLEPISQASADQRKGRCGRVGPGICYRLYSQEDFEARPRYTEPELKRSALAGVILRLMALGLGDVESFPFLDPPAERAISDGYQQLFELGAIEAGNARFDAPVLPAVPAARPAYERPLPNPIEATNFVGRTSEGWPAGQGAPRSRKRDQAPLWRLTDTGRTIARIPIDVKLARMLLESERTGTLREVSVIAAFLSIQDPRERPAEVRQLADEAHKHYFDADSDFIGIVKLWDDYREAHENLTQSKLRDWCQTRFLNFLRMREWRELHRQILVLAQELGWRMPRPAPPIPPDAPAPSQRGGAPSHTRAASAATAEQRARYEAIHRALLSGLPGQVARRDDNVSSKISEFEGTRGRRYVVFPGSGLAKKPPRWMLSATLLDTQRLYGLTNARVEPDWIEQQAPHLCKYAHYDPGWARSQGRVLAYERVTLFGLVLIDRRRVAYDRIDPLGARAVFIREALLPNEIDCRAAFVARNHAVLEDARAEESKRRRHGLVKDDEALYAWLDERIPPEVHNAVALDAWYKNLDKEQRRALEWTLDDVLESEASPAAEFPLALRVAGHDLAIEYRFDPRDPADGATLIVPLAYLNALPAARLGWLVPGFLREKVAELIRALPKALRKNFVPAPDFADAFVRALSDDAPRADTVELGASLSRFLAKITDVEVAPGEWNDAELAAHLRFNIRLLDETGAVLAESRDLDALRAEYGARARHQFTKATSERIARDDIVRWDFEDLPESIVAETGLVAHPALVDQGDHVAIRVYELPDEAGAAHRGGVARLLRLALAEKLKSLRKQMPLPPKAAIAYTVIASPDALRADVAEAALDDVAGAEYDATRSRAAFEALVRDAGNRLGPAVVERLAAVEAALTAYATLLPKLTPELIGFAKANFDDLREQLQGLIHAGFARELTLARLREFPRYLKAMAIRAERLAQDPRKDQARMLRVREFVDAHADHARHGDVPRESLDALRWAIEEFRVQEFAQELGTREAVSEKRLKRMLHTLAG